MMAQGGPVGPFVTLLGECVKQWKDDECASTALASIACSDAAIEKALPKGRVMSVGKRASRVCLGCGKRFPEGGAIARHWLKNTECLSDNG